jgi:hypothetical protein
MPIASQDVREAMNEVWVCLLGGGERLSRGVALVHGGCDWVGIVWPLASASSGQRRDFIHV